MLVKISKRRGTMVMTKRARLICRRSSVTYVTRRITLPLIVERPIMTKARARHSFHLARTGWIHLIFKMSR